MTVVQNRILLAVVLLLGEDLVVFLEFLRYEGQFGGVFPHLPVVEVSHPEETTLRLVDVRYFQSL